VAFDPNAYRKGVLSAIEARGGVPASDPFEWYDLPLDDSLKDSAVRTQIDAVWAFWQKQRDAPKYRGLVLALLARHEDVAALLWKSSSRRILAEQVRQERAARAQDQWSELDAAIDRLVERFGGVPESKVAGLLAFAEQRGIDEAAARGRVQRHPVVPDQVANPAAPDPFRRVRLDLEELGRLLERPALVSLFDVLDLPPTASRAEVVRARDATAAHNRELLPDRRRALVDDLLAAVTSLLIDGDPDAYLDALSDDVADKVRPKLAAAVLVEDVLTAEDADYLLTEAEALGLDPDRARDVLVRLAREAGVPMPTTSRRTTPTAPPPTASTVPERYRKQGGPRPPQPQPTTQPPASAWHEELSRARAALRAGRVREARQRVDAARNLAGGQVPPVRALSDEVDAVLTEATQLWKVVASALGGGRLSEAHDALTRLTAIAQDVAAPDGRTVADVLAEVQPRVHAVDAAVSRALELTDAEKEDALLAAWREDPEHPGLRTALAALGLAPASSVRAALRSGTVVVTWSASPARGPVDYRVVALESDGRRRVLGATSSLTLETAPPATGTDLPTYAVTARRAGVVAPEATSGPSAAPAADLPPVIEALSVLPHGKRVRLVYPAPAAPAQVRRLPVGTRPPAPGSVAPDAAAWGALVPAMGPGLAVDPRPADTVAYVAVSGSPGGFVSGAVAWFADLPAITDLQQSGDRLTWTWPDGITEVVLAWQLGSPPVVATDGEHRKVTNTRYQIDAGAQLPPGDDLHVAVFVCTRVAGDLVVAIESPSGGRLHLTSPTP
jgi:hypothetical protein